MNYCVSINQRPEVIAKVNQVRCLYSRIGDAITFIKENENQNKSVIIDLPSNDEYDAELILEIAEMGSEIICCVHGQLEKALDAFVGTTISFYHFQPVSTFYDLNTYLTYGVKYITIVAPLTFELTKVKKQIDMFNEMNDAETEIRLIPHLAQVTTPLRKSGLTGFWIHPRDIDMYEPYVQYIDFLETDLTREFTLLGIYQGKKDWKNNLGILILNLGMSIDGRALRPEFTQNRLNCGQRCESMGCCNRCMSEVQLGRIAKEKFFNSKE